MKSSLLRKLSVILGLTIVVTAGCELQLPGTDGDSTTTLRLTFEGLESLGEGFVYEGWIIVNGEPVSTGRFSIDSEGMANPSEFDIESDDAEAATTFVLTIEPEQNDPPEPADTHVLAGDFDSNTANLTVAHMAALGDSFADAEGSFILETPTTADITEDYDQGIWWLQMTDDGPAASLNLPTLPAGWVYEGWVVGGDGPMSTGRFTSVDAADDDGAGMTAGPDGAPPFPGQDLIDPAMMLIGYMAVISVEPDPDDSPAPFALKPLIDMDIEDVGMAGSQEMTNQSANNPTGTVELITP